MYLNDYKIFLIIRSASIEHTKMDLMGGINPYTSAYIHRLTFVYGFHP